MKGSFIPEPCLVDAILHLQGFIEKMTGQKATQVELAKTLKRYFILKELLDQIVWEREHPEE